MIDDISVLLQNVQSIDIQKGLWNNVLNTPQTPEDITLFSWQNEEGNVEFKIIFFETFHRRYNIMKPMKFLQFYAKNENYSSDIHLAYNSENNNFIITHREIEKNAIIRGKDLMKIIDNILGKLISANILPIHGIEIHTSQLDVLQWLEKLGGYKVDIERSNKNHSLYILHPTDFTLVNGYFRDIEQPLENIIAPIGGSFHKGDIIDKNTVNNVVRVVMVKEL